MTDHTPGFGSAAKYVASSLLEIAHDTFIYAVKSVTIVEAEVCPDHIHMLIEIPPKMSVSSFMGYLKGKSSQIIYERWANARYKYRNREFWCRGYYVDTVGKNTKKIQEYIKNQLKEDQIAEQLQLEFEDPFTGNRK